jgi:general secretion pathway protein G
MNRRIKLVPAYAGTLGSGFTLIELMIVIVIMGVLAIIGVTAFRSSQIKGRDSARKGDLKAISQALELYYNDNSRYPNDDGAGGIVGCDGGVGTNPAPAPVACTAGEVFKNANGTIYMPQLPKDPIDPKQMFFYDGVSTGSQFKLYARLENNQDPQIMSPLPAVDCGTDVQCNYGVSSGNISL